MTKFKYDPSLSPSENRRRQLIAMGEQVPERLSQQAAGEAERAGRDFEDDLIPEVYDDRSEVDQEIDKIIENIGVLDAYRRWIGKEVDEKTTSQAEGIKVSCPNPDHRDAHPSAWLNAEKKTWYCGGCQEGGDVYDLGAIKFDYPRPHYKDGKTFHELRREIAEDYGLRVERTPTGEVVWSENEDIPRRLEAVKSDDSHSEPDVPEDREDGSSSGRKDPEENQATEVNIPSRVTVLREQDVDFPEQEIGYPVLEWKAIIPEDTFLWKYMEATTNDDSPEEYHFWHGLLALGNAVGRDVCFDDTPDVYANFLVCLLGGTGWGKSKSRRWLSTVLREAVPWDEVTGSGCQLVPTPGSGERLVELFEFLEDDPRGGRLPKLRKPVNGLVNFSEFSGFLSKASQSASVLRETLMDFSDCMEEVSNSTKTGGTNIAIEPYCAVTSTTQPRAIRTLVSNQDKSSGFLNRWVFVSGPRKKSESAGGERSKIRVDLDPSIEELKKIRGWGAAGRTITWEQDAYELWDKWFHSEIEPLKVNDTSDLVTRIDLTLKRVLLCMAINQRKLKVEIQDVQRIRHIYDYLIACYKILDSQIGTTLIGEIEEEVERHITRVVDKTGRGMTLSELGKCMKNKKYPLELVTKALKNLEEFRIVESEKTKGPGRPTVRYRMVAS